LKNARFGLRAFVFPFVSTASKEFEQQLRSRTNFGRDLQVILSVVLSIPALLRWAPRITNNTQVTKGNSEAKPDTTTNPIFPGILKQAEQPRHRLMNSYWRRRWIIFDLIFR